MLRRFYFVFFSLAVVLLSCSGDNSSGNPPPGNMLVTVEVQDNFFSPKSITINPGDTVRWVLRGSSADHTVTDDGKAFNSGFVFKSQGDLFERTFDQAGTTFNYACTTHGAMGMKGSIRVGNSAPPPKPGY